MEDEKKEVKVEKKEKEIKVEKKEKEIKVEKKDQTVEIGFDVGMESIGGSLDVDKILDNIYTSVDN